MVDVLAGGIIVGYDGKGSFISPVEQLKMIMELLKTQSVIIAWPEPLKFTEVNSQRSGSTAYPATEQAAVVWITRRRAQLLARGVDHTLKQGGWAYIPAGIEFSVVIADTADYTMTYVDDAA